MAFSRVGRHTAASGELLPVRLTIGERTAELVALVDTGNTLTDPASGRPVMVAEGGRLTALFPKECRPERDDLEDPASGLVRLGRGAWRGRFSLLPYRAVGVSRGLLLAVRVDQIQLAGENKGPLLVALSPTPVSDGGGYGALIAPL